MTCFLPFTKWDDLPNTLCDWSLDVTWACSLSKFNRSHLLGGRRLVQGCRFLAASLCHRSHFSDLQFLCQPGNWQSTHRSPETWVEDIPGTQKSYTQYAHVDMADIPPTGRQNVQVLQVLVGRGSIFNPRDVERTELCDPLRLALAARSNGLRPFDVLSLTAHSMRIPLTSIASELRQCRFQLNHQLYGNGSKPCTPGEHQNSW